MVDPQWCSGVRGHKRRIIDYVPAGSCTTASSLLYLCGNNYNVTSWRREGANHSPDHLADEEHNLSYDVIFDRSRGVVSNQSPVVHIGIALRQSPGVPLPTL